MKAQTLKKWRSRSAEILKHNLKTLEEVESLNYALLACILSNICEIRKPREECVAICMV